MTKKFIIDDVVEMAEAVKTKMQQKRYVSPMAQGMQGGSLAWSGGVIFSKH